MGKRHSWHLFDRLKWDNVKMLCKLKNDCCLSSLLYIITELFGLSNVFYYFGNY